MHTTRIPASLRILALTGAMAGVLAGCATQAPEVADARLAAPADWVAPEPEAALSSNWLADFGDPALIALASEAMARNTDLEAAAARLEQARANAVIAGAARLPSVDATAGFTGREAASPAGGRNFSESYSLGLSASWEADVWGRVASGALAAERDAQASAADFAGARLSIAGSTAQAWFSLIEAELQLALAERDVQNRENSLEFIERRYRSGVNSPLDVRLSRSALASARATLALRRQSRDETARQLQVLLGRYPSAEIAAARELPELPPLPGAGAPGDLLMRRPDLVAAELRLESAGLRTDVARAALLPRLTLQPSLSAGGAEIGDLFDADALVGQLIANLGQPLFRNGSLRAEVDRNEAAVRERLASYVGSALSAWREAENALAADARLEERAEALRVAYEEAARAEELAERQYNQGLQSIFNLLDAQGRRISSESQYISVRRERAANRVRLQLAIGGDFTVPAADFAGAQADDREPS